MDRRHFLGASLAFGTSTALPACAAPVPVIGGSAFGSYWRVALGQTADMAVIVQVIDRVVAQIDDAMSPYRPTTELSQLNASDSTDRMPVSSGLATVLKTGLEVAHHSQGAFDPTVGGIVGRYGFGPITGARVGDASDLDLSKGGLRRAKPGMTVDLCGVAKGRALDLIGAELAARGVTDALVDLGGEVLALGRHPEGRAWRVAIEVPGAGLVQALQLSDQSIATSGDRPQGYAVGNRRYGHIIDPRGGLSATGDLASVSVIGQSAMRADAFATALFAAGTEQAIEIGNELDLSTVLLVRDGAGLKTLTTGQAQRWLL